MIEICYISSLCSKKVLQYIFETAQKKPGLAIQKFHRLLAEGLGMYPDDCHIRTLNTVPVIPSTHKRKFWKLPGETFRNVKYKYIPIVNLPFVKNIGVFLYTFFSVLFWPVYGKPKMRKIVVCDVLNLTVAAAAILASGINRIKAVTIVTDFPGMMVGSAGAKVSFKAKFYKKAVTWLLSRFDGYILLTQQMNEVINPNNKPYMIMEGLVDLEMLQTSNLLEHKFEERVLIYAGGLYEKYGIKTLIKAFSKLKDQDVRLNLYGKGQMVSWIQDYQTQDPRVKYMGIVPNEVVVADQLKATLLINPRPTTEEFTKYSFPSKNMEYMVSGTPMVTTNLPGMPREYRDYVFLFEDESQAGMHATLKSILDQPRSDLHDFGLKSKEFVVNNKSNLIQAKRILKFLSDLNGASKTQK